MREQTWSQLEKDILNRKVALFGVSVLSNEFFSRYQHNCDLVCAVDNDVRKQGLILTDLIGGMGDSIPHLIIRKPEEALSDYTNDQLLIIIASVHHEEIGLQLEKLGFYCYYAIPLLLSNTESHVYLQNNERKELVRSYLKLPLCKNKIVFRMGRFGGHGKYITKALLNKGVDVDIVWIVRNNRTDVPDKVRLVYESNWQNYYQELETAAIWIYDEVIPKDVIKRKGQTYIYVKHWASITLKTFGLDVTRMCRENPESIMRIHFNSNLIDYVFTGSQFDEDSCKSGLGDSFKGKFIRVGSPRSDVMFESQCKEKVYKNYNLNKNCRTLLYAPTFRYDENLTAPIVQKKEIDFVQLKNSLVKKFGGEWSVFLRLHPSVAIESSKFDHFDSLINASYYEDSQELASASDIMISDYSSYMFEPAFVGKPVFLFAPDRREYKKERTLLIDYDKLPFPIAETNEELKRQILTFDEERYRVRLSSFMKEYGVCEDGHASERAADFIIKLLY